MARTARNGAQGWIANHLGATQRRRVVAILRMAYRVVRTGRNHAIGRLSGGGAMGALLAAIGATTIGCLTMSSGASAAEIGFSSINFALGTNAFTSSLIKEGLDPAYANKQSDPISPGSLSVGYSAYVAAASSLAVGDRASVLTGAAGGTALGASAMASAGNATAIGHSATASNANAVALGVSANASGVNGTAIGNNANASGEGAIALGRNTVSSGLDTIAIGTGATATNSVALGAAASAGAGGTALGDGAKATTAGGVALGKNSVEGTANATASTMINGTTYNFAGTTPTSVVSVGSMGAERQITNVAAGRITSTSTDAINGSQLFATNQAIDGLAAGIGSLTDGSVLYDKNPDGTKKNSVTLIGGDPSAPVLVSNVKAGVADTDAVNVKQLKTGMTDTLASANTYTDQKSAQTLNAANSYTDQKFGMLSSEIGNVRKEARQAAAVGLAAASLRYDDRPGKVSAAVGGGAWRGEGAFAMGLGYTSENQRVRVNVSATTAGRQWGVGAGLSYTFN